MMQRVNFLRERTVGLSYKKMTQLTFAGFALVAVLALVQNMRLNHAQSTLEEMDQTISELKDSGKGALLHDLGPIQAVSAILSKQVAWDEVLDAFSRSVGDGIWLENITGAMSTENELEVLVKGVAYRAGLVPSVLNRISSFEIFSQVNLISTEATNDVDAPFKFTIRAKIRGQ